MSVILFVDMLGSRKLWQSAGTAGTMPAFFRFKKMMKLAASSAPTGGLLDGAIETDCAMLVCRSTVEALLIAKKLFRWAFAGRMHPDAPRPWYRGCILPHVEGQFLRVGETLGKSLAAVSAFRYSPTALEAVSVEKSGYRGMRLLVKTELIDATVKASTRTSFGNCSLIPFRRLDFSYYPPRIDRAYVDFLWMAAEAEADWHDLNLHMTCRLRYAAREAEEFAQAAATQVVFDECTAIRQSVVSRAKRSETDPPPENDLEPKDAV